MTTVFLVHGMFSMLTISGYSVDTGCCRIFQSTGFESFLIAQLSSTAKGLMKLVCDSIVLQFGNCPPIFKIHSIYLYVKILVQLKIM